MYTFNKRSGIILPNDTPPEILSPILTNLTRISKDFQSGMLVTNEFYSKGQNSILIPRYFPIERFMPSNQFEINDVSHEGDDINISHNISLRSNIQKLAAKRMFDYDSSLIKLEPGVGKTVIAIYAIAHYAKKSLILVHRDSLVTQWKERFSSRDAKINNGLPFTNLNPDDIAVLSTATMVDDFKKPIIISTAQTMISLLKNRRMEFFLEMHKANIGIFIGDEVHTSVGAPGFSKCSLHIPARRVYGLSATPYRADGNGDIIHYHLGELFEEEDSEGTMKANVTVLLMDYNILAGRERWLYWEGKFQKSRYYKVLKNSKPFMKMLIKMINKVVTDGRDIILTSERIKFFDDIFPKIKIDESEKTIFKAGSPLSEITKKVVLATPGKIRDGLDRPQKDCLIMTTPISNISQISGRITREQKGKPDPIIIDMVDVGIHEICRSLFSRIEYYEKKKWSIQYLYVAYNGEIKPLEKVQVEEMINERIP